MTVTYGFYDSLNGDRKYNASQMSKIFEGIITDGIFTSVGTGFVVTYIGGTMNVNVGIGRAWFNGTWTYNDANLTLTVQPAEAVLNRIDTVVIEVNSDSAVRANSIKIIKGTPASSPVAPTLTNSGTIHQYPLADIYVGAAVSQILAGNITNRIGTTATPLCTALVPAFNISTLMNQYTAEFESWLADLQNELDSNQAANLQNQINVLESNVSTHETRLDALDAGWIPVTETWTYLSSSTLTVPSDATTRYQKGDFVRLKQGAGFKYFNVIGVTATVLTLTGGSNYTLTNATITDISYSVSANPHGHPLWYDTGTLTVSVSTLDNGSGGQPTTVTSRFCINGTRCTHKIKITGTKAGAGKIITFNVPTNMPAHLEANLTGLGTAYIGNVDYVGTLITQSSGSRSVISADSIVDNQDLTGGITAMYTYEF